MIKLEDPINVLIRRRESLFKEYNRIYNVANTGEPHIVVKFKESRDEDLNTVKDLMDQNETAINILKELDENREH